MPWMAPLQVSDRPPWISDTHSPASFGRCLRESLSRSRRLPRQALDVPEDLPKEVSRQVAFGKLEYEVPGVPNEAPSRS